MFTISARFIVEIDTNESTIVFDSEAFFIRRSANGDLVGISWIWKEGIRTETTK